VREVLNRLELLLGVFATRGKHISHLSRVLSNGLGHTINCAELRRDVAVTPIDLNDEKWLLQVSYLQIVVLREVLRNAKLLAVMRLEPHSHRGLIEVNILHEVGLLVPVSANHSLELKLVQNLRLLVANIWGVHDLVYPF